MHSSPHTIPEHLLDEDGVVLKVDSECGCVLRYSLSVTVADTMVIPVADTMVIPVELSADAAPASVVCLMLALRNWLS